MLRTQFVHVLVQIKVKAGGTVCWMLIGMGTENEMHSPLFRGQVRLSSGMWRPQCSMQRACMHAVS